MSGRYICICFFSFLTFFACKKDIEPKNDVMLQKFWKLEGFYNGEKQYVPKFDLGKLFHYEVNIIFLWNDFTKVYEIQGQAPVNIFWGELFSMKKNDVKFKSLETTSLSHNSEDISEYEKKFFNAIKDISSYEIVGNDLFVRYENDSQEMHFVLKERQYLDEEEYCTAKIDGYDWSGEKDMISGYVRSGFEFGGCNYNTKHADGYSYDIGISAGFSLQKGEFDFNNEGITMLMGGTMGICSGRKNGEHSVPLIDTRSVNGAFGITLWNPSFIEGYFYFDAEGCYGDNIGLKRKVTNGKFLIRLNTLSDWLSPYKFDN